MVRSRYANNVYKTSKNRSAKHLIPLTGPGTKSAYRSLSNEALEQMARGNPKDKRDKGDWQASAELKRRADKRAKKEAKA